MASRALKIEPQRDVTSEPEVQTRHSSVVDEVVVALRAYELWQARGLPRRIGPGGLVPSRGATSGESTLSTGRMIASLIGNLPVFFLL